MGGYLPKSKVKIQETPGGELVTKIKRRNYIGPYIETSEGKYYTGRNVLNWGVELIKPKKVNTNFGGGEDFETYTKIKPYPFNHLSNMKNIPSHKSKPIEEDYEIGFYFRFFAKRINSTFNYIEISPITYTSIKDKQKEYDHNLYKIGKLKWSLRGNVQRTNNLTLKRLNKKYPFLSTLFPLLNEFQLTEEDQTIEQPSFSYQYPGDETPTGGSGY